MKKTVKILQKRSEKSPVRDNHCKICIIFELFLIISLVAGSAKPLYSWV